MALKTPMAGSQRTLGPGFAGLGTHKPQHACSALTPPSTMGEGTAVFLKVVVGMTGVRPPQKNPPQVRIFLLAPIPISKHEFGWPPKN